MGNLYGVPGFHGDYLMKNNKDLMKAVPAPTLYGGESDEPNS